MKIPSLPTSFTNYHRPAFNLGKEFLTRFLLNIPRCAWQKYKLGFQHNQTEKPIGFILKFVEFHWMMKSRSTFNPVPVEEPPNDCFPGWDSGRNFLKWLMVCSEWANQRTAYSATAEYVTDRLKNTSLKTAMPSHAPLELIATEWISVQCYLWSVSVGSPR